MTALMAKKLSRSFGEEVAVDDIDLEIHPGEIHAIVGLNGAGKTTLMRLMLGMLRPGTGEATILGSVPRRRRLRCGERWGVSSKHHAPTPSSRFGEHHRQRPPPRGPRRLHADRSPPPSTTSSSVIGLTGAPPLCRWATVSVSVWRRPWSTSHRSWSWTSRPTHSTPQVWSSSGASERYAARDAAVFVSSHHLDQLARVAHRITVFTVVAVAGTLDPAGVDVEQQFFDLVYGYDLTHAEAGV